MVARSTSKRRLATLTRELRPAIAEALNARRALLESTEPVRSKYALAEVGGDVRRSGHGTSLDISPDRARHDRQLSRSRKRMALAAQRRSSHPADVHPLKNPGLELTGPWHPLDMAFNALNSAAPMNMPDFEDASPAHFQPERHAGKQPVATFAALQNAKEIFEGRWASKAYEVVKKGKKRSYKINRTPTQVAHAAGSSAQHSHCLRADHGRWHAGARHHRAGGSLGVQ